MRIRYAIVNTPLDRMLLAATDRGICALSLSDSDTELEAALASDYPSAELVRDDSAFSRWIAVLLDYLRGEREELNLPLDVQPTDFQRRVWDELRAIPYGSTRTYKEIARNLGLPPSSSRAVGRACATNLVSLVIPCHRAVKGDGGLAGFRWGLKRKRALLERESLRLF